MKPYSVNCGYTGPLVLIRGKRAPDTRTGLQVWRWTPEAMFHTFGYRCIAVQLVITVRNDHKSRLSRTNN